MVGQQLLDPLTQLRVTCARAIHHRGALAPIGDFQRDIEYFPFSDCVHLTSIFSSSCAATVPQ
jgi:hypothetical protein